ncbi:hypothetical protein [Scleromatobacter humisilvae]|uniref:Uncharacterized protein n=1 Tax=Scleromatobacter humisilvae TaxID=2897159 RepID=A0A9X1YM65_9BURK|nr:hypothetical protein [Scleromatobacter humisilvae]MCK9687283.1 hypothetical protein [Scleromatobacter humisilvae]
MHDSSPKTLWHDAEDFQFGLDVEGRLMVSWAAPNGIEGLPRFGVLVPASALAILRLGLAQSEPFQAALSVQAPPSGAH